MTNNKRLSEIRKKARHPWEYVVIVLAVIITIALFAFIAYALVFGANDNSKLDKALALFGIKNRGIKLIINIGGPAIFLIILFLLYKLCMTSVSYIGNVSIKNVRLQDSNYKEVKDIYARLTKDLGVDNPPIVYIGKVEKDKKNQEKTDNTKPNFLGVTVCSNKAICLNGKLMNDAIQKNDYSLVEYELAENLADIYLNHYDIPVVLFTFVARLIPYFKDFFERIMCYSNDAFVKELVGKKKCLHHLYLENFNLDAYDSEDEIKNIENIINGVNRFEKSGRAYENFLSKKPIVVYRLDAIYNDKPGRVI